ncbi:hypothetical protein QMY03_05075 [Arthrobacter sp. KFRI-F3372]|uniref:hypothetical protein n=1 Tax=Pseudarthrobacter scleromae TaxID=158897 RepID=UPI0027A43481|nr:hypothetical protein QMY03_05075 [Arthrobacter sp. KFRI-F3372]
MPAISPHKSPLRVSTSNGETISLTVDAGAPVNIQLDVGNDCTCGGAARRAGAYTDTDFGTR